MKNDIENNIDETFIPEFTTDMIIDIDTRYYAEIRQTQVEHQQSGSDSESESEDAEQLYDTLHYNELINEHVLNIEQMYAQMYEYNSIEIIPDNAPTTMKQITEYNNLRINKRLFYLREIEPIIINDSENLRDVISILSYSIQTISS